MDRTMLARELLAVARLVAGSPHELARRLERDVGVPRTRIDVIPVLVSDGAEREAVGLDNDLPRALQRKVMDFVRRNGFESEVTDKGLVIFS